MRGVLGAAAVAAAAAEESGGPDQLRIGGAAARLLRGARYGGGGPRQRRGRQHSSVARQERDAGTQQPQMAEGRGQPQSPEKHNKKFGVRSAGAGSGDLDLFGRPLKRRRMEERGVSSSSTTAASPVRSVSVSESDARGSLGDDDSSSASPSSSYSSSSSSSLSESEDDSATDLEPNVPLFEKVRRLKNSLGVKARGEDVPEILRSFDDLLARYGDKLDWLVHALRQCEYYEPSAVQRQVWPVMLEDREVVAIAPTGSGKTLAFVVPTLALLGEPDDTCGFRAVIISPTRELALQIHREIKRLCDGGKAFRLCVLTKNSAAGVAADAGQKKGGERGAGAGTAALPVAPFDVLVTTPQRLVAMVAAGTVDLSAVQHLIFDEADKLFGEEQFLDQVGKVVKACSNPKRRVSFFSATMLPTAETLARSTQSSADPVRVSVGDKNAAVSNVAQSLVFCGGEGGKLLEIRSMAARGELVPPTLIFCQSKDRAQQLFREMAYAGIPHVDVIHAGRTAAQRQAAVDGFRSGDVWILVATDVMARGLDFKSVKLVINYDFPQTTREYIHRVGRTGRAGKVGRALTFFTERDAPYLQGVAGVMKRSGSDISDWVMAVKPASKSEQRRIETRPIRRMAVSRQQPRTEVDSTRGKKTARVGTGTRKKSFQRR